MRTDAPPTGPGWKPGDRTRATTAKDRAATGGRPYKIRRVGAGPWACPCLDAPDRVPLGSPGWKPGVRTRTLTAKDRAATGACPPNAAPTTQQAGRTTPWI